MDDFELDYQILQSHLYDYKEKKTSLITKMLFYELKNYLYLYYGRIRPKFDDESFEKEILEYQHFKYFQNVIPHKEIDIWIRNLIYPHEEPEKEPYFISGNEKFFFSGQTDFKRESYDPRWLRVMKFHPRCRTIFTMRYPSQSLSRRPDLHATNPKLPYYPTIKELILHKFGFSTDSYSPSNSLHFALVPFSGYISKIFIENDSLIINVENKEGLPLTLKLYGETKTKQCETFNFTTTKTDTFVLSSKFSTINVTLVNQDGILLDTREFFKKDKLKVEEIEDLIHRGEGETVDFKLWDPDIKGERKTKRRKKFARLLTAFSNNSS